VKCEAGMFSDKVGASSCTKCADLTYSGAGAKACIDCPANSLKCTSASDFTCKDGYYENKSTKRCVECPAGYFCKN
jgi:hypothetical protein